MLHHRRAAGDEGGPTRGNYQKNGGSPSKNSKVEGTKTRRRVRTGTSRFCRQAFLKRVVLLYSGVLMLWYLVINPALTVLFGNGYNNNGVEGGLLGRAADRWLEQDHVKREAQRHALRNTHLGLRFPPVVLRSNRKEVPGYSRFLEEVLSLRPEQHSSVLLAPPTKNNRDGEQHVQSSSWDSVQLVETVAGGEPTKSDRVSVAEQLRRANCRPGWLWLCHRCLNSGLYGSLSSCEFMCPPCYADILCELGEETLAQVAVSVTREQSSNIKCSEEKCRESHSLIPKVIHQFWKEPLSTLHYPELVRIQNGWRSSAFVYHFYTPASARKFVDKHYPAIFLRAWDSIHSFDVQSDLFRLLVLFKEGGIYANVDLMLETNLESLVTPNLLFFAARDDSRFDHCLWNGFIGTQAGHPFIGKAIESVMETVLNRMGLDDVERDVCRTMSREAASWKLRTYPGESVFGSCALGMAVHQTLGHSNVLESFPLGLLPDHLIPVGISAQENKPTGENLILLMSKNDTGAFRCSDVERNLLVASTAMLGLTTDSLESRANMPSLRSPRAKSLQEEDIYVPVDKGTSGESIRFVYSSQGNYGS